MANSIPLTFRAAPFPEGYRAGPEQFKNDLVARLYAESAESISFFAAGSVMPSSNVGPWLKNDNEWYVWSTTLATYVPQVIGFEALKYIAQAAAPDPTKYTFWIELDGTGKAIAIKYYSGGAWKDVYEDKFATFQPLNSNLTTLTTSTLGDIIYSSATDTLAKLAGNTTTTRKFLRQTGTGAVSAAPVWDTLVAGDIPDISATYQPLNSNLTTITTSTLGDIIYSSAANTLSKLAGNTTSSKRFLTQTGTGAVSAAPGWNAIVAGDIPDISATYKTVASFNTDIANYSTTAQMNAAIAAATFEPYPAQAVINNQTVPIDGAAVFTKLTFNSATINPSPAPFDATTNNRYIAPAAGTYSVSFSCQCDNSGGTASAMEVKVSLYKNGVFVGNLMADIDNTPSPNGSRWSPGFSGLVALAQNDYLEVFLSAVDGVNTGDLNVSAQISVHRVSPNS